MAARPGQRGLQGGAAIFAHLAVHLQTIAGGLAGTVVLLYDVDEHTGGFGGANAYFEGPDAPERVDGVMVDGVMIGYPGADHVVIGGRGVLRARVHVHGIAGHSGAGKTAPSAIAKPPISSRTCTPRTCRSRPGRHSRCRPG
jgi:succinyl-diaminopimelate desuccinylase